MGNAFGAIPIFRPQKSSMCQHADLKPIPEAKEDD